MSNVTAQLTECRLGWEQIARIFTQSKKKLRLRIVDTVFLQSSPNGDPQITGWYFTSKKGETSSRKGTSSLTLQHVYDRFCRVALTGANAAGPRIIAVGYLGGASKSRRVNFTAEQMEREVKNRKCVLFEGCTSIQCYLHPCHGKEHCFRGVYTSRLVPASSSDEGEEMKNDVTVYLVEDPMMATENHHDLAKDNHSSSQLGADSSALLRWIQKEVDVLVLRIVQNLEKTDSSRKSNVIAKLSAEFILDNDRKLWLARVDDVAFGSGDMNQCHIDFDTVIDSSEDLFLPRLGLHDSPVKMLKARKRMHASTGEFGIIRNQESFDDVGILNSPKYYFQKAETIDVARSVTMAMIIEHKRWVKNQENLLLSL